MACGCGGRGRARRGRTGANAAQPVVYRVTSPQGEVTDYMTALEARRALRQAGGGTLTTVPAAAA